MSIQRYAIRISLEMPNPRHSDDSPCVFELKLRRRRPISHRRIQDLRNTVTSGSVKAHSTSRKGALLRPLVSDLSGRGKLARDEGRGVADDKDILVDAVVVPEGVEVAIDFEAVTAS